MSLSGMQWAYRTGTQAWKRADKSAAATAIRLERAVISPCAVVGGASTVDTSKACQANDWAAHKGFCTRRQAVGTILTEKTGIQKWQEYYHTVLWNCTLAVMVPATGETQQTSGVECVFIELQYNGSTDLSVQHRFGVNSVESYQTFYNGNFHMLTNMGIEEMGPDFYGVSGYTLSFARRWQAFFYHLEALHGHDHTNLNHLLLLHRLFLNKINDDCVEFQMQWNSHLISGAGHDQSPDDMFLLGQLENSVYLDDYDGVYPDIISEIYATYGSVIQQAPGETGAGQLDDEDVLGVDRNLDLEEADWKDMIGDVEAANEHHFHHEPVAVPKHLNPFLNDTLQIFEDALAEVDRIQVIPPCYELLPEE
ncbi:hypothetical protein DFH06DRAFT_1353011 [Mycena polygramma]|nr:hypothetical protein DFH06DRAFT_1353011 [Mycena polygramma]